MATAGTTRRGLLGFLTNALMLALALLVAIPAVAYFLGPLRRRSGGGLDFQDVGPVADIPQGEWRLLTLETVHADGWKQTRVRHAVWVRRQGEGQQGITVFSSICPHLGCPINWHPDREQFNCPCHGGVFDATGRHTAGPPPRSMDPLEFEIRGGHLWVRWQDFKIGVAERTAVSV
jgi:Rieske Fe-S protein